MFASLRIKNSQDVRENGGPGFNTEYRLHPTNIPAFNIKQSEIG